MGNECRAATLFKCRSKEIRIEGQIEVYVLKKVVKKSFSQPFS